MLPAKLNLITWPTRAIRFSDWLLLKKSPLKLLGQMEPNLAGSIYARSFCLTLANQKKELLLAPMFIGRMEPNDEAL
jgi:hypothetical protein